MASFADGTSPGGLLRFVDADLDGWVGDGDRLLVRLNSTADTFDLYLLSAFGGGMGAVKLILNGPQGPWEAALWGIQQPWTQLVDVAESSGPPLSSTFEIQRTFGPRAWSDHTFTLQTANGSEYYQDLRGPGTTTFGPGYSLTSTDLDGDGLVDEGDRFVLSGLPVNTSMWFRVFHNQTPAGSIGWYPGYGHVSGQLPEVRFTPSGSNPYSFLAAVPYAHSELALGRTLAASLLEDGTRVLDHRSLVNGTVGSWANGNLTFSDRDGDGMLSDLDEFVVSATAPHRYRLEVSVLWDSRTYAADVGP